MNDKSVIEKLKLAVRDIPDFPKPSILFKDITPVLLDPALCESVVQRLAKPWIGKGIEAVAGIESRGFLFGLQLAILLNVPFIPIRKAGKLPSRTLQEDYELEYGFATLEMHADALQPPQHVLIHDDLLATGGTAQATRSLLEQAGGEVVGYSFLIELGFLEGRNLLVKDKATVDALINY